VYLFDTTVPPLQYQMHNRECENLIRECILNRIRESIPIENILKSYLDETDETNIEEEVIEQYIDQSGNEIEKELIEDNKKEDENESNDNIIDGNNENNENKDDENTKNEILVTKSETPVIGEMGEIGEINKISFNDNDEAIGTDKQRETIEAPKNIERLEQISKERNIQRKLEEEDDDEDKIKISDTLIDLNVESLEPKKIEKPIELNIETLG
jgi:hypothetical protein